MFVVRLLEFDVCQFSVRIVVKIIVRILCCQVVMVLLICLWAISSFMIIPQICWYSMGAVRQERRDSPTLTFSEKRILGFHEPHKNPTTTIMSEPSRYCMYPQWRYCAIQIGDHEPFVFEGDFHFYVQQISVDGPERINTLIYIQFGSQ